MGPRTILLMLPTAIKEQMEIDGWRDYLARCARITTQNTAALVGGAYIGADFAEMIKPRKAAKIGEARAAIGAKLR